MNNSTRLSRTEITEQKDTRYDTDTGFKGYWAFEQTTSPVGAVVLEFKVEGTSTERQRYLDTVAQAVDQAAVAYSAKTYTSGASRSPEILLTIEGDTDLERRARELAAKITTNLSGVTDVKDVQVKSGVHQRPANRPSEFYGSLK
ncbi:hypothetical protein COV18_05890 [Candidatus Woesearchaeota archaeon CG10_big_fil_rev_8_21_14_0_10_37_12]|nr:MAG: hypothetical protein COV18_05890 [Candidatus Woesearchaeota archaeon CG10_big_fil_rev_8_21_14_0_10_37_12]